LSFRSKLTECSGFSLIEVVLVVLIMSILASVAAQKYTGVMEQTRMDTTREEMTQIGEAIVGNPALTSGGVRSDFGYVGDVGALPTDLDALVNNPGGFATWNGPYVRSDFEQHANDFKQDSWGANYEYDGGVRLTSNGSGSAITKQFATSSAVLTSNTVQGVLTDGLNNPPGARAPFVEISIRYPDGAGALTTSSVFPASGGNFSFGSVIPVGNHEITASYEVDTVVRYVSVLPGSAAIVNFRLPGDVWAPASVSAPNDASAGLRYVTGSATAKDADGDLTFDILNPSGRDIAISSIQSAYAPTLYFEAIQIGSTVVAQNDNPRGASGDTQMFETLTIPAGSSVTVSYQRFRRCVSGGCAQGDTRGVHFAFAFSDGSSMSFMVP